MMRTLTTGLLLTILAVPVVAQDLPGDSAKGAKVFKKCKACHAIGDDAKNKTGPHLNGIVNAAAGAREGFKYSKALQTASADGLIWTPESLDEFLTKPKAFMKGTKMSFAGLKKEKQRIDLIKFLSEQLENGS